MTDDLLALLVEVTSVSAAGKQLKKPIEVPRPDRNKGAVPPPESTPLAGGSPTATTNAQRDRAFKRGIGVLAATSKGASGK